jgi:hypothetical protein
MLLYGFLHNVLNVLVHIANKMELQKEMELRPSREAISYAATQELLSILWNLKVY